MLVTGKKLINWFVGMNMISKVGVVGSFASVLSIVAMLFSSNSISDSQTTYGINSPNIKSNGDVNINYGSAKGSREYNYIQHPNGGGTILVAAPHLTDSPEIICHPEGGSRVKYIEEQEEFPYMIWVRVQVESGTCKGKTGWIGKDNYRTHSG